MASSKRDPAGRETPAAGRRVPVLLAGPGTRPAARAREALARQLVEIALICGPGGELAVGRLLDEYPDPRLWELAWLVLQRERPEKPRTYLEHLLGTLAAGLDGYERLRARALGLDVGPAQEQKRGSSGAGANRQHPGALESDRADAWSERLSPGLAQRNRRE